MTQTELKHCRTAPEGHLYLDLNSYDVISDENPLPTRSEVIKGLELSDDRSLAIVDLETHLVVHMNHHFYRLELVSAEYPYTGNPDSRIRGIRFKDMKGGPMNLVSHGQDIVLLRGGLEKVIYTTPRELREITDMQRRSAQRDPFYNPGVLGC
ncbi:MAG: hypothetical protein ABIE94_04040 [archaeon]